MAAGQVSVRVLCLILLAVCTLYGCVSNPQSQGTRPQDEWPVLGWETNMPSLDPVSR